MLQSISDIQTDLVPQAIINRPIASLVEGRAQLVEHADDLDYYEGASFVLDGDFPFAVRRYRGYPANTSTIYLDPNISDIGRITAIIRRIIGEFHLPEDCISWQRRDDADL